MCLGYENVTDRNVEVMPIEKMRLFWRTTYGTLADDNYMIGTGWKSNTRLQNIVPFKIICKNEDACAYFVKVLKEDPKVFEMFELQYVTRGQKSSRREINIDGSHVKSGKLFTNLTNMNITADDGTRYLSSKDVKEMTQETVQNVLATVTVEAGYISTGDEISVASLLERLFRKTQVDSASFDARKWESTFWRNDMSRPDKVTSFLNNNYGKEMRRLSEEKSLKSSEGTHFGGGVGFSYGPVGVSASGMVSIDKKHAEYSKELQESVNEHESKLQWTGEKFTVKPMKLSRINVNSFRGNKYSNELYSSERVRCNLQCPHKCQQNIT